VPEDQVDIEADLTMPVVVVHVYDEGEGILPADQQKIFEKFVRASRSLTTPVRGSGLGLYICRRYIEAMGGRLWLQHSIPGEGSAFSFYLPRIEGIAETGKDIVDESTQQTA
jgi:signal transduction histidine kinase